MRSAKHLKNLGSFYQGAKPVRLSQGQYTEKHNQVLWQLAITLEVRRTITSALPPVMHGIPRSIPFGTAFEHWQGWIQPLLTRPKKWLSNASRPFPATNEIYSWAKPHNMVKFTETFVHAGMMSGCFWRSIQAEMAQVSWNNRPRKTTYLSYSLVEFGCRGFVAMTKARVLKMLGVKGWTGLRLRREVSFRGCRA